VGNYGIAALVLDDNKAGQKIGSY